MANMLFPRPKSHTVNTACYFIERVFGEVEYHHLGKPTGWTVFSAHKDGEMVAFYDEESGDLWTTVH